MSQDCDDVKHRRCCIQRSFAKQLTPVIQLSPEFQEEMSGIAENMVNGLSRNRSKIDFSSGDLFRFGCSSVGKPYHNKPITKAINRHDTKRDFAFWVKRSPDKMGVPP
jgi:hypothetical protein